jgi:hypothetical protein
MKNRNPINIKNLPKNIKEAWFYKGKESSVHIVFNKIIIESPLVGGIVLKQEFQLEQLNLNLE